MKNYAASAAHGQGRVGPSGCDQKALLQRFLTATTAQQSFSAARKYQ
jgi:hypothetical protein